MRVILRDALASDELLVDLALLDPRRFNDTSDGNLTRLGLIGLEVIDLLSCDLSSLCMGLAASVVVLVARDVSVALCRVAAAGTVLDNR